MKLLADLLTEIDLGLHVCGYIDDELIAYVFRKRGVGSIIYAHHCGSDKYTLYCNIRLIREDDPRYDPRDYENFLSNYQGVEQQPIWRTCVIPDELMKQFLAQADEEERWWKQQNAQLMYAMLKADRRRADGEDGLLIENVPLVDPFSDYPFDDEQDKPAE